MSHRTPPARRRLVAVGAAVALVSGGAAVATSSAAAPGSPLKAAPEIEDPSEALRISGADIGIENQGAGKFGKYQC